MFKVSIVDIEKMQPVFTDLASSVILPGEEGELAVLDFHQPIVSRLRKGTIKIDTGKLVTVKIQGGIAGMNGREMIAIVER